jgi:hypothetical protein
MKSQKRIEKEKELKILTDRHPGPGPKKVAMHQIIFLGAV